MPDNSLLGDVLQEFTEPKAFLKRPASLGTIAVRAAIVHQSEYLRQEMALS